MAERVKVQGVVRRITKGEVREEGEVPPSFVQIGGVSVLAGREVADLPGSIQAKLLRVLEDRQFEPVGSNKTKTVNTRVLLATNLDLAEQVKKGKPNPEGFLLSLQRLNEKRENPIMANQCIVIEDSHWGLEAAKAAGMHTIAVTNSYDAEQLRMAERIVSQLNELSIDDLHQLCVCLNS